MRTIMMAAMLLAAALWAADKDLEGGYAGEWKSGASGNGGAIRFTLEPAGSAWKGTVVFALDGTDVPCTMRSVKLQDGKVELVYDFDVQNYSLRSKVSGAWNGSEFRGAYETTSVDGSQSVDAGTWSAKRTK
jgi:hypothetical protein